MSSRQVYNAQYIVHTAHVCTMYILTVWSTKNLIQMKLGFPTSRPRWDSNPDFLDPCEGATVEGHIYIDSAKTISTLENICYHCRLTTEHNRYLAK